MRVLGLASLLFSQGILAGLFLLAAAELAVRSVDIPGLDRLEKAAVLAYAQAGRLLHGFMAPDDKWRLPLAAADVDPQYLSLLLAYEDANFWRHPGIDVGAFGRAARLALRNGRVVSGGSTLTMQLVRLLDPQPRRLQAKLLEVLRAVKLERRLSKEEILGAYLTIAPFGSNIEGVRAASLVYFGKEPAKLSLQEAALLVALPQAPETRRPDRAPAAARAARDRVLRLLAQRGVVEPARAVAAAASPLAIRIAGMPQHAPHLALRLKAGLRRGGNGTIRTLLDGKLQLGLEELAKDTLSGWEDGINVAILVVRNVDGAVVGYVGSGAPDSKPRQGHVDLVRAVRSPGSALKPFIYAMAFEKLIVHPDTIVADQPIDVAGYRPDNADGEFSGDMSIRQALLKSRNTVPVMLLDRIGVSAFLSRFRTVGSPLRLSGSDSEAGLAVALGGVGISLEQLVWFYSSFAREGKLQRLRFAPDDERIALGELFAPAAANAVADILADVPPPAGRPRLAARDGTRRIGYKTGTSFGFRDAWTIGFDTMHTVGVWIGRPDGAPLLGAYGVEVAAPLAMQVFDMLPVPATGAASGREPLGALASPRELPQRLRRFGAPPASQPFEALQILFPKSGAEIIGQRSQDGEASLPLRVSGGRPPYQWTILGQAEAPQERAEHRAAIAERGQIDITVQDADGQLDRASFWLE